MLGCRSEAAAQVEGPVKQRIHEREAPRVLSGGGGGVWQVDTWGGPGCRGGQWGGTRSQALIPACRVWAPEDWW